MRYNLQLSSFEKSKAATEGDHPSYSIGRYLVPQNVSLVTKEDALLKISIK
jgi:hypothetical protein